MPKTHLKYAHIHRSHATLKRVAMLIGHVGDLLQKSMCEYYCRKETQHNKGLLVAGNIRLK